MAKKMTSSSASQKLGMAKPTTLPTWMTRSSQPPRTAAAMPSRAASTVISAMETTTIDSVTGRRRCSSSPMRTFEVQLLPRSPRSAPLSQSRYCVVSGRSRPSSWLSAAICSCEALSPSRLLATFFVEPNISAKVRIEIENSRKTPEATRRAM